MRGGADLTLAQPAQAGVDKLYILNCGEGVAGDISRWSPGVNDGKSMAFVDNCYLIKHSQGWFLWDTGIPDAVAAMPNGLAPADPRAVPGIGRRSSPPSSISSASSRPTSRRWRSRTPIRTMSAMSRCSRNAMLLCAEGRI